MGPTWEHYIKNCNKIYWDDWFRFSKSTPKDGQLCLFRKRKKGALHAGKFKLGTSNGVGYCGEFICFISGETFYNFNTNIVINWWKPLNT